MKQAVIGVDIGGTNTVFGIVDRTGKCSIKGVLNTQDYRAADSFVKALYDKIEFTLLSSKEKIEILGMGIGAPNGNYYRGTIEYAPNLPWRGVTNLLELFRQYYQFPLVLTNDANAAAIGEMKYGEAKGMKDFIVITIGTGLGSGIVVNGELLYGHGGFAGELGHTIVIPNGRLCGCGRKGCLETYVSARGIQQTVIELMEKGTKSELTDVPNNELYPIRIYEAAKNNDAVALAAFEFTGKVLGRQLADTVAHVSPEAVFLFGGIAKAGDLLLNPTQYHMEENLLIIYKNKVKLLPSGLTEENAAILGSAALAWEEIAKRENDGKMVK